MDYLTSKEASELWGIGQSRILRLAREGRIEGAVLFGKSWMIPKGAAKPADGRTRRAKSALRGDCFRFPLFVNDTHDSYTPPLSEEERQLQKAQADFFSCRFEEAYRGFFSLSETAESIYVKICATAFMAALSACYDREIDWKQYYHKLNFALAETFPHKEEMKVFLPWLHYFCGLFGSVAESISFRPEYEYHPSVYYLTSFLSVFLLSEDNPADNRFEVSLIQNEILCRIMEQNGHFCEAQELHSILFISYYMSHTEDRMLSHLRQMLRLAQEHGLLYDVADLAPYYSDVFEQVIGEFPADLMQDIFRIGKKMQDNYARFSREYTATDIYCNLSDLDFQLILYVFRGNTNRQIAEIMHLSVHTVANKLSVLYEKLNIRSRQELVALFRKSMVGNG